MSWTPVSMGAIPMFAARSEQPRAAAAEVIGRPAMRDSYSETRRADAGIKARIASSLVKIERVELKRRLFAEDPTCSHCGRRLVMEGCRDNSAMLVVNRLSCGAHATIVGRHFKSKELEQFEFSGLQGISETIWLEMARRLRGHAIRVLIENSLDSALSGDLTNQIIELTRRGRSGWNPAENPNVLRFMFDMARDAAVEKGTPAIPQTVEHVESLPAKHRRRRGRGRGGRGILSDVHKAADVNDIIHHLPTIALLIGRLNDLLNPIAKPTGGES